VEWILGEGEKSNLLGENLIHYHRNWPRMEIERRGRKPATDPVSYGTEKKNKKQKKKH
jgi:hypothetical protein